MSSQPHSLSRRTFLRASTAIVGAGALATVVPRAILGQSADGYLPPLQVTSPDPTPDDAATVLVGDVLDYRLTGDFPWNGGSVTFRLHEGRVDGEPIRFIRTDSSDSTFAEEVGLVWVPLLGAALSDDGSTARMYLFDGAAEAQLPVFSTAPGNEDYTPLLEVINVSMSPDPVFGLAARPPLMESEADVLAVVADGKATLDETGIVVNYPVVTWPGGELPVDGSVELPLAGGPLLAKPDLVGETVTFKLHKCFPESRYIITDTSASPMAPRMNIVASPPTADAASIGAASRITVFANGLTGPGAMGFQPGVFREKAGDPAWSPLWNHFTAAWKNPDEARLLTSQEEIDTLVEDGTLELFAGTPNTGGQGFVVNCPSPITAPDDVEVTSG